MLQTENLDRKTSRRSCPIGMSNIIIHKDNNTFLIVSSICIRKDFIKLDFGNPTSFPRLVFANGNNIKGPKVLS